MARVCGRLHPGAHLNFMAKKKVKKKTAKKKKVTKKALSKKKKKTPRRRVGRPKEYKVEYAAKVMTLKKPTDFTLRAIGRKLRVSPQTVANWKAEHEEFAAAVATAKETAVDDVEGSFFDLAMSKKVASARASACAKILAAYRKERYGDKMSHEFPQLSLADIAALMGGKRSG